MKNLSIYMKKHTLIKCKNSEEIRELAKTYLFCKRFLLFFPVHQIMLSH